jgi:hypothetical protein
MTIDGNTGRVTSVNLDGPQASTPLGRCVEGLVRRTRFPRLSVPTISIAYPLVFDGSGP